MTTLKPTLKINRLLAVKNKRSVYDEEFHSGLNILSGCNGGGKTSIVQLLVYGLGYDVQKWKEEAGSCDQVFIECEINGQPVTINRDIEPHRASMQIYFGKLTPGLKAGNAAWFSYPYASGSKESFSQKLFELLEMPEVKVDTADNMTMHQILRLVYSDQANAPWSIFNVEGFDSAFKREAIGKYLCGLYDDELYKKKIDLAVNEKALDKIISEIRAITNILGKTEMSSELFSTEQLRSSYLQEISSIRAEILDLQENNKPKYTDEKKSTNNAATDNSKIKERLYNLEVEQRDLEFEAEDIRLFLSELNQKIREIDDSIQAGEAINSIQFKICPCCFSELEEKVDDSCSLCGSTDHIDRRNANMLRMKNELKIQSKESTKIYETKKQNLENTLEKKRDIERELRRSITKTIVVISSPNSANEKKLFTYYSKIGELEQKILDLEKTEALRDAIRNLSEKRENLQAAVSSLKSSIELREGLARIRPAEVDQIITDCVIHFLRQDSGSEKEFKQAAEVDYDFAASRVSVNNKTYFSESSIAYLNNAFHLALLKLSLTKEYARFPRLVILDGIENFGLEDQRSQNLQMNIKEYFSNFNVEHQIIIATKCIHPDLNAPGIRVGEHFTEENKSLDM